MLCLEYVKYNHKENSCKIIKKGNEKGIKTFHYKKSAKQRTVIWEMRDKKLSGT